MNIDKQHNPLIAAIERQASSSTHRICTFVFEGKTYIIKKQRHCRSRIRYSILTAITKSLFMPALQGIYIYGGKSSQSTEIHRLKTLSMAGILVPQIIYENDHYFVMSYMGDKSLDYVLQHANSSTSIVYWEKILKALAAIHDKGAYLSQAFLRNMILHESQEIAFIDFEDDPCAFISLNLAQTRDWLLCILSSSSRLQICFKTQAEIILSHLSLARPEVRREVLACASKIALLRFFFRREAPYKNRDVQSLKSLIYVMHELKKLAA